jgi:hypothetical protein
MKRSDVTTDRLWKKIPHRLSHTKWILYATIFTKVRKPVLQSRQRMFSVMHEYEFNPHHETWDDR